MISRLPIALATIFALGLVAIGQWRRVAVASDSGVVGPGPTLLYVAWTVAFLWLLRSRVDLGRYGFEERPGRVHMGLAAVGVALLLVYSELGSPILSGWVGAERDLGRFEEGTQGIAALSLALLFSWLFAALGEELVFRVILLRIVAVGLGEGRGAWATALGVQALVFGLVHSYQGPVGILETCLSGLVYGGLVLAARRSIWPAVLAHGTNNTIGLTELFLASGG